LKFVARPEHNLGTALDLRWIKKVVSNGVAANSRIPTGRKPTSQAVQVMSTCAILASSMAFCKLPLVL